MTFQDSIGLLTLGAMVLVAAGFLYVISQVGKPADAGHTQKAYQVFEGLRRWLFAALFLLGVGISYATLSTFPIPLQQAPLQAAQVVDVVGHQWRWDLSTRRIDLAVPVEFRVTSADVNHGFAIYGPDDRIVIQTQAMPGFVNKILHTFQQPGAYRILCLEYCGLAHHGMTAEFEVAAADGASP